jgi:hypothetical protein
MEPVLPRRPVDNVAPRATVTVRPLFTYLLIFDWLLGFVTGMVLFVICNLAGAPTGVQAAGALAGVVVWVASWLRTVFGEYRAWARIHFRTLSLPLTFPPAVGSTDSYMARTPRTWIGRHANRQRQIIRRELAARGYSLPDEWGSLADLDGLPDVVAAGPHGEVDERDKDDQGGGTLDGPVGRSRLEDRTRPNRPGEHDAYD